MSLKNFLYNKIFLAILISGLLLNGSAWLIFWLGLDFDKTALILHYNSFFGIDRIAINSSERGFLDVFFAPLGGLVVMLINFILGGFLVNSSWKRRGRKGLEAGGIEEISTAALGGWFIIIGGVILQLVILVYTVAIFLVNK